MSTAAPAKRICVIPGCRGKVRCRGLCESCYFSARKRIKNKEVTWSFLVRQGLALEPQQKRLPFSKAVDRKLAACSRKTKRASTPKRRK
jgi:NMD protein affecting ribosome stability and mRNA decay